MRAYKKNRAKYEKAIARVGRVCALPGCEVTATWADRRCLRDCSCMRGFSYCGEAHQKEDWMRHKGEEHSGV